MIYATILYCLGHLADPCEKSDAMYSEHSGPQFRSIQECKTEGDKRAKFTIKTRDDFIPGETYHWVIDCYVDGTPA